MKKAIIIGATSGIGLEVTKLLLKEGYKVGIAGRRESELIKLYETDTQMIRYKAIDITAENATEELRKLIAENDGMDLFFNSAGIGHQNRDLEAGIELETAETNVLGFLRMITTAFNYFKENGGGHIAAISSIAGTKGLGSAPSYSATKRFQNSYIEALAQLANTEHLNITFTDIRPGFVRTNLLDNKHNYPLLMNPEDVAKEIVNALKHKRRIQIIDWRYRIIVFFWRLIPRCVWEYLPIKN